MAHNNVISLPQAIVLCVLVTASTTAAGFGVIDGTALGMIYTGILGYALGNFKAAAVEAQKQSAYRHRVVGTLEQLAQSYRELAEEVRRNAAS